jgi:hypothetical protein
VLAAFAPPGEETAILLTASGACFAMGAFFSPIAGRFPGGSLGLIARGLGLWVWPTVWNTAHVAFR